MEKAEIEKQYKDKAEFVRNLSNFLTMNFNKKIFKISYSRSNINYEVIKVTHNFGAEAYIDITGSNKEEIARTIIDYVIDGTCGGILDGEEVLIMQNLEIIGEVERAEDEHIKS
ncbi:MAG: hypothetical protein GX078_06830 [Clostridiales bacterium]|nr:hypothetical protein [Clostridiales bacterium]